MGHRRDWQKTDPDLHNHPGFTLVGGMLGVTPVLLDGMLASLWRMAYRQAEDGDITRFGAVGVAAVMAWAGDPLELMDALKAGGFIEQTEDGRTIIDGWDNWGGALFSERAKWTAQKAESRQRTSEDVHETTADIPQNPPDPRAKTEIKSSKSLKRLREIEPDFPAWWDAYGRGGSRADALVLYLYWRSNGAGREELLAAATNYRAWCESTNTYKKHGATFLAKKPNRWEEWVTPDTAPAKMPHDPTTADFAITCGICRQPVTPEEQATTARWGTDKGWVHESCRTAGA